MRALATIGQVIGAALAIAITAAGILVAAGGWP